MLCIQTASRAASRAPGCHTLGSTPIKITSLHFYLHLETSSYSSFSSASVCSLCLLLLTPSSQEEVTFAAWQSNGTPGGVCPVWAWTAGPQQCAPAGWHTICHRFAMLSYTEEQYAPHQYARAYNMSPRGLYNGLIFTLCSVIVQRATNEANYPKEPRAVVGDALTYIPVWPDCSFGQPTYLIPFLNSFLL